MPELEEIRQEARRNTRGRFEQWAKNPTCNANTLSAVHNVRLDKAAEAIGLQVSFGQSPFAIARGNRFEVGLFWDQAQKLRAALERKGCLPESSDGFLDLRLQMNGGARIRSVDQALEETEAWLRRVAADPAAAESIVAAPMIKIPKGVILPEALLIIDAVTVTTASDGRASVTVGEVKVFPDRGGHTDPQQLASARAQAGVYEHALRLAVDALGLGDEIDIATHGFLVFTWPGSNSPSVRANEDLTFQAIRAERGFERLEEVALGIVRDDDFSADNPALIQRVLDAPTDYSEACLAFCDLAPRCHARALAADNAIVLGGEVARFLGDTTMSRALELMAGAAPSDDREADLQRQLIDR
ncbi:hypothetical protein [Dietzia cinnamea]|uniref:hypothetical protein n=1 Tax=Dietzia cinnamea TaxID=321318 RepID=UPI0021A91CC4|nr:hypothetical protein [Dietzia cinnamea]MCT2121746.1 hypothetical protein [Dietzia cinnamea]MCT2145788.1 hypothetical protein [Dietzia cinnamea]MCT2305400.1 hypothetical protein [Dietzia cinnamea]